MPKTSLPLTPLKKKHTKKQLVVEDFFKYMRDFSVVSSCFWLLPNHVHPGERFQQDSDQPSEGGNMGMMCPRCWQHYFLRHRHKKCSLKNWQYLSVYLYFLWSSELDFDGGKEWTRYLHYLSCRLSKIKLFPLATLPPFFFLFLLPTAKCKTMVPRLSGRHRSFKSCVRREWPKNRSLRC